MGTPLSPFEIMELARRQLNEASGFSCAGYTTISKSVWGCNFPLEAIPFSAAFSREQFQVLFSDSSRERGRVPAPSAMGQLLFRGPVVLQQLEDHICCGDPCFQISLRYMGQPATISISKANFLVRRLVVKSTWRNFKNFHVLIELLKAIVVYIQFAQTIVCCLLGLKRYSWFRKCPEYHYHFTAEHVFTAISVER
jgi:hypothetical protein